MTEIVEYSLVVMVSTLFVGGSVVAYNSFSSFESGLQLRATFAAVSSLATQAIENGSSRASITLPDSAISCHGGSLSVTSGTATEGQDVPASCDFYVRVGGGPHIIRFREVSSQLELSVT